QFQLPEMTDRFAAKLFRPGLLAQSNQHFREPVAILAEDNALVPLIGTGLQHALHAANGFLVMGARLGQLAPFSTELAQPSADLSEFAFVPAGLGVVFTELLENLVGLAINVLRLFRPCTSRQ